MNQFLLMSRQNYLQMYFFKKKMIHHTVST